MTLDEIAAQAATSGEYELAKFAFSCIRLVEPSALLMDFIHQPKLVLIYQP